MTSANTVKIKARQVAPYARAVTTDRSVISGNGCSVTFDAAYPSGQSASGRWWIVAPNGASITATSPASVVTSATTTAEGNTISNREMHGMGINPTSNNFDSFTGSQSTPATFGGNVALAIDAGTPLTVQPGNTLVKSVSLESPGDIGRPVVKNYLPIDVLREVPPEGGFSPSVTSGLKEIPVEWRKDQIDWSKVPNVDSASFSAANVNWVNEEASAQSVWMTWIPSGNRGRNLYPDDTAPGTYRFYIGNELGKLLKSLSVDDTQANKEGTMWGLIQIGLDLAETAIRHNEVIDPSNNQPEFRMDIGLAAPVVLAALMLPNNGRLLKALEVGWRLQDLTSFQFATQANIDQKDDDTRVGAVEGQLGHPDFIDARPADNPGIEISNYTDAVFHTPIEAAYRKTGSASMIQGVTAIHLFTGSDTVFGNPAIVHYLDRYNSMIEAAWPNVGDGTGYEVSGTYQAGDSAFDRFREVRSQMTVAELSGVAPERPEPVSLVAGSGQLTVSRSSNYVGHGAARTQTDIRYIEVDATPAALGTWTEIQDITFDGSGNYVLSLPSSTKFAVCIRDRSANGTGAWSRNFTFFEDGVETSWTEGVETTLA